MKTIMFNEEPFRLQEAVLCGRKTATRRVVPNSHLEAYDKYLDGFESNDFNPLPIEQFLIKKGYPKYVTGEEVSIAQSYESLGLSPTLPIVLKGHDKKGNDRKMISETAGWKNKMYVAAEFMCHVIRITDVRVELLSAVHDQDAKKEGIIRVKLNRTDTHFSTHPNGENLGSSYLGAYISLFNRLAHADIARRNPYVYVYEFELVK